MIKVSIERSKVWEMCVKENWYKCGDVEDYSNMLMNLVPKQLLAIEQLEDVVDEIACDIAWHSEYRTMGYDFYDFRDDVAFTILNNCCVWCKMESGYRNY